MSDLLPDEMRARLLALGRKLYDPSPVRLDDGPADVGHACAFVRPDGARDPVCFASAPRGAVLKLLRAMKERAYCYGSPEDYAFLARAELALSGATS